MFTDDIDTLGSSSLLAVRLLEVLTLDDEDDVFVLLLILLVIFGLDDWELALGDADDGEVVLDDDESFIR